MASTGEAWRLGRRPALDGVRGVAVLLVVLMHLRIPTFQYGGTVGVTVFFVLSGFLITALLLDEQHTTGRVNLRGFWVRRAARLLPALVVFLAVLTSWHLATGAASTWWPKLWGSLLYYANFLNAAGEPMMPVAHVWSLSVEEQFYLLWPLLVVVVMARWRSPRLVLAVALVGCLASVVLRVVVFLAAGHPMAYFSTPTNAFGLLAGGALAAGLASGWRPQVGAWVAPVALAGVLLVAVQPGAPRVRFGWQEDLAAIPAAVLAVVLIVAVLDGWRPLEWGPLGSVGRVSYGLYLWHGAILLSLEGNPVLQWGVGVPATVAATWLSWRFVEQPALRQSRRWSVKYVGPAAGSRLSAPPDSWRTLTSK